MLQTYDIEGDQGSDYFVTFTYQNSDGSDIDVTDYGAVCTFSDRFGSFNNLLSLTVGSGITIDGPAGQFALHATAAQTSGLPPQGAWMLVITSPLGVVSRLVQGDFTFNLGAPE